MKPFVPMLLCVSSFAALSAAPSFAESKVPADMAIPAAFHGVWGSGEGACADGASLQRFTIDATGIIQADGAAAARQVKPVAGKPNQIAVRFAYSGGGEEWEGNDLLSLSDDGHILTISGDKKSPLPGTLTRCDGA